MVKVIGRPVAWAVHLAKRVNLVRGRVGLIVGPLATGDGYLQTKLAASSMLPLPL
jgi:hypothetical protein